jgi:hypothetical protein
LLYVEPRSKTLSLTITAKRAVSLASISKLHPEGRRPVSSRIQFRSNPKEDEINVNMGFSKNL